jgi:hypothetical protein
VVEKARDFYDLVLYLRTTVGLATFTRKIIW